jgi:preprotein translocase subunit YajC
VDGSALGSYLPLLFIVVLYLVLIRPQNRRRKEQARMNASLKAGDAVVTIGGLHGEVVAVDGTTVDLAVTYDHDGSTPDVVLRYERSAIARLVPSPTAIDADGAAGSDEA